ncbi:hypothetical protein [Mesorhizobium sp. WSM3879]|uniref:hypothetical protein n=1 Tax=Mesorhizobium sp. WSM3879 TaxID=2029406 RepID=UPI00117C8BF9|nr:hypothetical protein [Mesorhizobium sp. WSM3879]
MDAASTYLVANHASEVASDDRARRQATPNIDEVKDNRPPLQGPKQKARVQTALSHEALEKPSGQFIVGMTNSAPSLMPAARPQPTRQGRATEKPSGQFIVGMTNSAPSLMPAARPQPQRGEDAQPKNRPVSSSSG